MASESLKIATKEFRSPISKENSFASWNVTKRAKSTMTLYFDTRERSGFIEWDIPAIEETITLSLEFELQADGKQKLVEYGGNFDLPTQAMDLLEENGIDCAEMRKSLAS